MKLRSILRNLFLTAKYMFFRIIRKNKFNDTSPIKLHLGCGKTHLQGWVNIDVNNFAFADIVCNFMDLRNIYLNDSVSSIKMIHSISYLRLFEARDFFKMCFDLLIHNGTFILEFPDIIKCAKIIIENDKKDNEQYIEGVRGFYAFDLNEVKNKKKYIPYMFGWSAGHIEQELIKIGFSNILISDGEEHNRPWRDTRIEAKKP